MKPAFHRDATIFGYVVPNLFAGPIHHLTVGRGSMGRLALKGSA